MANVGMPSEIMVNKVMEMESEKMPRFLQPVIRKLRRFHQIDFPSVEQ